MEWRHDGSRLVVPVTVYPPLTGTTFEGVAGNALIDTGSTTTGVTGRIAEELGLQSIGKRLVSTVGGERQIDRYIFRIGLDGRAADNDAPTFPYIFEDVVGFELLDSFSFDVLLGMDILRQCELLIAPGNRVRQRFGV
ncbi:aspartyl protease family protein [Sphingomonas sp. 28-63-12]|uniref:aspartyl protease family protein n=1 Tax=Sphingomonas sp. 28-63-12 TaxID=1970434 RepID=UPI0035A8D080